MRQFLAAAAAMTQLAAAQQQLTDHDHHHHHRPPATAIGTVGLRDVPLAGGTLQSLDGPWSASCDTAPPSPQLRNGSCSFETNVDLDVANVSTAGMMSAKDAADCCYQCWNRPGCFAAVRLSGLAAGCWLLRCPAAPCTALLLAVHALIRCHAA